jgi:hypothetical protein
MKEQFSYRARKWLLQKVSTNRRANQHRRLENTDWDILVVLDACSASALKTVANWPIETVVSPASCTPGWLTSIQNTDILDGHIISANPQYEKFDMAVEPYYDSHWDDDLSTVLPEPILDRASELADTNERVIAHLQQPHWPYVAKFDSSWKLAYPDLGPWNEDGKNIDATQVAMARGHIDLNKAKQAYYASVHSVWSTVVSYANQWSNQSLKTVITADHGETFGRLKHIGFYEHPCQCHIPPLTHVPWVEIAPDKVEMSKDNTVANRLKALGYAE